MPGDKSPLIRRWEYLARSLTPALLEDWIKQYPYCSWGVPCGRIVAIDLDEDDPRRAALLLKLVLLALGPTRVRRIGRPNRVVLVYRALDQVVLRRIKPLEVLAGGAQFVAYGIHRDTKRPYSWPDLELTDVPLEDLPPVTQAKVSALLVRIRRIYRRPYNPWEPRGALTWETVDGKVVDGREAFMTWCVLDVWREDPDISESALAQEAWERFAEKADLTRPKGNRKGQWSIRDATAKARGTLRKAAGGGLKQYDRLIRGAAPARPVKPILPLGMAETYVQTEFFARYEAVVDAWRNGEPMPLRWLLGATSALGKTEAALKTIHHFRHHHPVVWYAVKTHKLAKELTERYNSQLEGAIGAFAIRGRTHGLNDPKADAPPLCARAAVVAKAIAAGITDITSTFCYAEDKETSALHMCPHFWAPSEQDPTVHVRCPYFGQFDGARGADVYFVAHEYLFLEMDPRWLPEPNIVIIDESMLNATVMLPERITPEDLLNSVGGAGGSPVELAIDILLQDLKDGKDPRPHFRRWMQASGADPDLNGGKVRSPADMLRYMGASAGGGAARREIRPGMSDSEIEAALENVRSAYATGILRRLADELDVERPGVYSIYLDPAARVKTTTGEQVTTPFVYMQWRRKLRLPKKAAVLILDGTAEPELLRAIWPDLNVTNVRAARHACVVQTHGYTASMQKMLAPDALDHNGRTLAELCRRLPAPGLLVTYKGLPVSLPEDWSRENLGNLRGTDDHRDKATAVVVGRLQMTALDAERQARGLWYDRPVGLQLRADYKQVPVGFNLRNGESWGVATWRHPDPRVDLVRASAAEREIEQAVDRLRLVRREGAPALVVLVNETPTDIPVDALVPWRQLRGGDRLTVVMLRLGGVVPLVASWLAEQCPDPWPTANAVECELRRRQAMDGGNVSCLGMATTYRWRPDKRRGRASMAWSVLPVDATRGKLEGWFGPLDVFEPE
jgi:hypothetical protein